MGNYNKWNRDEADIDVNKPINVVLFVSRNKDNKHIDNFKERRNAFVTTRDKNDYRLVEDFKAFVRKGEIGEMCRMYISVNPRSNVKTQKALLHQLIDEDYNMATLPQRIAAIAAKKENAADSKHLKWMFDFDPIEGQELDKAVDAFLNDVYYYHNNTKTKKGKKRPAINIESYKTPNGYAVVVDQRFDTRELLKTWTNVELKRDDLLCTKWVRNNADDLLTLTWK